MFTQMTEQKINEAVTLELNNACKVYGAEYHSLHEAYAVLLEEVEETKQELDYVMNNLSEMWNDTKANDELAVKADARFIAFGAVSLAMEAVQVAAVARKILGEN